ncbi:MAG: hypothetical protein M3Y86_08070, partial [Verrucomicrobiota bacterium]|nr:hypothetical protein [Verrucomicrobiota bacterium]
AAIDQWKLSPIVGAGSGTYQFYGRQFRDPSMQGDPSFVHNDYLHLLAEYGLLGGVAFLIFLGAHLRQGWLAFVSLGPKRIAAGSYLVSDRFALTLGALCAVAACAVHSAFDFNLHIPANALVVAAVFGLLANPGTKEITTRTAAKPNRALKIILAALSLLLLVQCARLLPGEYYANEAQISLRDEDPRGAAYFADQALRFEHANPNIYFLRGRALVALAYAEDREPERLSYFERALAAFDRARQLAPLDGAYPMEMAFLLDDMGRFEEAEWMHGLARARDPRSEQVEHMYQNHLRAWRDSGTAVTVPKGR